MAIIVALMAMLLMSALGAALVLTTSSEALVAANFRNAQEGVYAADAALERAMADLASMPDWQPILDGSMQSGFVDGPPSGVQTLADGSLLEFGERAREDGTLAAVRARSSALPPCCRPGARSIRLAVLRHRDGREAARTLMAIPDLLVLRAEGFGQRGEPHQDGHRNEPGRAVRTGGGLAGTQGAFQAGEADQL